jgi:hypothetical protein
MRCIVRLLLLLSLILQYSGCATAKNQSAREVSRGITQAEVQQDLQRFASIFIDRVGQATEDLTRSKDPHLREVAVRRALAYGTNVLDIVSEPLPELAFLDMVVFVSLSRAAFENYWAPEVLKNEGQKLSIALNRSERDIWAIAAKVMTPKNIGRLKDLIIRWQRENIGQHRVEEVRLGEFSKYAGKLARERSDDSGGLFANVASGVEAADQALLTTDRILFLAQRMPYLLRLHAILGTSEVLGSVSNTLAADASLGDAARRTMNGALSLTQLAGQAAREGRELVEALHPLVLPIQGRLGGYLVASNQLASQTITILDRIKITTWQIVLLMIVGSVCLVVTWGGVYYFVKRRLLLLSRQLDQRNSKTGRAA